MLLLNKERMEAVLDKVPCVPLKKNVLDMTVGEFLAAMDESYVAAFLRRRRALKAFGMLKEFRRQMEEVSKYMEACSVEMSADERAAMAGIDFPDPKQRMLLDVRESFGLSMLESRHWWQYGATDVPLAEYLIILKDKSSAARFERNRQKQMERKSKKK